MKVFYHNDLDGQCAANIIAKPVSFDASNFIEMQYGKAFPFDIIAQDETVYILDYSIEPEEMEQLLEITTNIVWIDHHITAINKYADFPHQIAGIRKDGVAGCVLTYQYSYPGNEIPWPVLFIGDRDIWAFKYGDETKNFCSGIEIYETDPLSEDWFYIYENVATIKEAGKNINKYKYQRNKDYLEDYKHVVNFEGYEANCVNVGHVGSELFDSLSDLKPIQIMYAFDGTKYRVSLRSTTVDVSALALKYGGGGHVGASGFECTVLPWTVIG